MILYLVLDPAEGDLDSEHWFSSRAEARKLAQEIANERQFNCEVQSAEITQPLTRRFLLAILNHEGFVSRFDTVITCQPRPTREEK